MNWSGARVFKLPGIPQTFSNNSRRGITRPSFSTKYRSRLNSNWVIRTGSSLTVTRKVSKLIFASANS